MQEMLTNVRLTLSSISQNRWNPTIQLVSNRSLKSIKCNLVGPLNLQYRDFYLEGFLFSDWVLSIFFERRNATLAQITIKEYKWQLCWALKFSILGSFLWGIFFFRIEFCPFFLSAGMQHWLKYHSCDSVILK